MSCTFNKMCDFSLMSRTKSCRSSRNNFSTFCNMPFQQIDIFVINFSYLFCTQMTHLFFLFIIINFFQIKSPPQNILLTKLKWQIFLVQLIQNTVIRILCRNRIIIIIVLIIIIFSSCLKRTFTFSKTLFFN